MSSLTLYYDPLSPPARFVVLVAENLGLKLNLVYVNSNKCEIDSIDLKDQNTIPTLIDHDAKDLMLWEPRAIATYLIESRFNNHPFYPNDPVQRAIINQRLYFDASTLIPRIYDIIYPLLFDETNEMPKDKIEKVYEAFWWLNSFLEINTWVAGNTMTVADLAILIRVQGVLALGASLHNYPHLERWREQIKTIPGYEENEVASKMWADVVKQKLTHGKGF